LSNYDEIAHDLDAGVAIIRRFLFLSWNEPTSEVPEKGSSPKKAKEAAEKLELCRKNVPQGLKPDVFSIVYGPTKVVP
jgi:hypothetical protein